MDNYQKISIELLNKAPPTVRGLFVRVHADVLYPPFLRAVLRAQEALVREHRHYWITQAYRTWAEQDKLYAQGRTDKSKGIVTNAKGGESVHNYWAAVDATLDSDINKAGLQPSWDSKALKYWADANVAQGLEAGYYWTSFFDAPHVQLPLSRHGISVKQLREVYKKGGRQAVFALYDTIWGKGPPPAPNL